MILGFGQFLQKPTGHIIMTNIGSSVLDSENNHEIYYYKLYKYFRIQKTNLRHHFMIHPIQYKIKVIEYIH